MKDPLSRIEHTAAQQLAMLERVFGNPDVDRQAATAMALELILQAIGRETALGERVAALYRQARPVQFYLIDLSTDWRCRGCQQAVAQGAQLSGVRKGQIVAELLCANCHAATPLTPMGMTVFNRVFGAFVSANWNPRNNGFGWDGT